MSDPIPPQDANIISKTPIIGEKSPYEDPLNESVNMAKQVFAEATRYFESRGKGGERYDHLSNVADINHTLPLDDTTMTDALVKQGIPADYASVTPAFYIGERGGVVVDTVAIRKGAKADNLMIAHEFAHRAAEMRNLQGKDKPYQSQMWEALGYPKDKLDALKLSDPKEYQRVLRDTKETMRVFNEGLNQWVTIFLAERTDQFPKPIDKRYYADEVAVVRETFESSLNVRGLAHSSDQIDEIMLDLALTGDFSRLKAIIPAGEDLHKIGIDDNFYVANLMQLADGRFQARRLERLSKMQETT